MVIMRAALGSLVYWEDDVPEGVKPPAGGV
jgi:hypothetical protein